MKCNNCGAELSKGAQFCLNCGAAVPETGENVCPECGKSNAKGDTICKFCGWPLPEPKSEQTTNGIDHLNDAKNRLFEEVEVANPNIIYIIIGVVLVIIAVVLLLVFSPFGSKDTENEVQTTGASTETSTSTNEDDLPVPEYSGYLMNDWYFYDYYMRETYTASASSVASSVGYQTYYADDAIDNDSKSMWMVDADNGGKGEWIALENKTSETKTIREICFLNGHCDTDASFAEHSTPTKVDLSTGDSVENAKRVAELNLITTDEPQAVDLSTPVTLAPGQFIVFTIKDIAQGTNPGAGICISDIRLVS